MAVVTVAETSHLKTTAEEMTDIKIGKQIKNLKLLR